MHESEHRGLFLTIEGIEGVGKSTALRFIQNYLTENKIPFIATREPGGTKVAEQIREILLKPDSGEPMASETELLLMFASRAQHIANLIKPALLAKQWVVSDRFVDASFAYQGGGRGFDIAQISMLEKWVVGDLRPDATILLDAPPDVGMARAQRRGNHDRIEQEKVDFFERVRAVYLARAQADAKRFHVLNAAEPLAKVQAGIKTILDKLLAEYRSD
jgi:dTMP kinase